MSEITVKGIWEVLKKAGQGFSKDKVMKLSASLAYYTIFSLGPMFIVIIFLAEMFFGSQAIEGTIYEQVRGLVGDQAAMQVQEIIKNAAVSADSNLMAGVGIVALLVGATTVFADMQDSLNIVWGLKVKTEKGWLKMLLTRLLSFSLVIALAFLLLVSLVLNGLLENFMDQLQEMFPGVAVIIIYILNLVLTLVVIGFLFAIIFKVLPDAVISWKDVAVGAIFTAVLFMIAKFGISLYIGKSDVGGTYGAAGSLVVLVLWVYFTSVILYFGAEFTKAYAMKYGEEIKPNEYTVNVQVIQVETENKTVQENEKEAEDTQKKMQDEKNAENKK